MHPGYNLEGRPHPYKRKREHLRKVAIVPTLVLLAFVASACLFSKSPTSAQKAATALAQGLSAQNSGNYSTAVTDYNQVVTDSPGSADATYAYYDLGTLYQIDLGNLAQSEIEYRAAIALSPNYVPALFNLAVAETPASPVEAESLYQQIITIDPKYAAAYLNLGFAEKTLHDTRTGDANIKEACVLDPTISGTCRTISTATSTTIATTTPTSTAKATTTTTAKTSTT